MSISRAFSRSSLLRALSVAALLVAAGCDSEAPTDVPLETAAGTLEGVQGILVRFGLGGPQGLEVFAPGFPRVVPAICGSDSTGTEGKHPEAGLFYNRFTDRYALLVQTEREWSGSCQDLLIRFVDGTEARARFRFR